MRLKKTHLDVNSLLIQTLSSCTGWRELSSLADVYSDRSCSLCIIIYYSGFIWWGHLILIISTDIGTVLMNNWYDYTSYNYVWKSSIWMQVMVWNNIRLCKYAPPPLKWRDPKWLLMSYWPTPYLYSTPRQSFEYLQIIFSESKKFFLSSPHINMYI